MTTGVMTGFGYKMAWLAIQASDPIEALHKFGADQLEPIDWRQGVQRAYREDDVIVATPPLTGADGRAWVLVVGRWLARQQNTIDVVGLSAATDGEVQLFATHRVVETHRWERAVSGVMKRSFEYSGESGTLIRWHGDPQQIELALGLPVTADPGTTPTTHKRMRVNEAHVMRVAAAWSVDPTSLDGQPASALLTVARPAGVSRAERARRRPPRRRIWLPWKQ